MSITKVTKVGFFKRITNSIFGVLIGIVLFLGSFVLLWKNEGRVDLSKIAENSVAVSAETVDSNNESQLIAVSGNLTSDGTLGDGDYLQAGDYISLSRNAEMYAWVQHSDSNTKKNVGGSQTTTTEYTYSMEWTSSPRSSENFEQPDGHFNPTMNIDSADWQADSVQVGAFQATSAGLRMPSSQPLNLSKAMVGTAARQDGDFLFIGKGSNSSPKIGDTRLSYTIIPKGNSVTLFGQQQGNAVVPFLDKGDAKLFGAWAGSREAGMETMHNAYTTQGWLMRVAGFGAMWAGLGMMIGPLTTVLDILPFLGTLGRGMVRIITFAIAFILSLITVIVSMIAHNIFALIAVIALVGGGIFFWLKRKEAAEGKVAMG